jgi:hypothetical protein
VIADTSHVQRFLFARLAIDAAQRARSEVENQLLSHVHCVQFHCFGLICLSSSAEHPPNADSKYLLGFLLIAELHERPDGRPQEDTQGNDADPPRGHISALDCLPASKTVLISGVLRPTVVTSGQRDHPEHHAQRRAGGEKALDLIAA